MSTRELKNGAILSYLLIIVNSLYGIFFTPFLLKHLGVGEYGVYKIISSFSASIAILDLGIGGTVLRYIAKYRAENDNKKVNNFYAMSLIQASIMSTVMLIVCVVLYFCIDSLYGKSLSVTELKKAKQLFIVFTGILVFNTIEKVFFSVIAGCGHYTFSNSMKLCRIVGKVIISFFLIIQTKNSLSLLLVDFGILLVIMTIQIIYIKSKLHISLKLYGWDRFVFKESLGYTILMFLQSIAVQFNGNLDNLVIGAVIGAATVAVYSVGLQLYNMYEQFAMAFSDLMLPTISKQIADGADNYALEDTVIKVGRLEFMALGGALCAYTFIGKEFVNLWLGNGYNLAWVVGLILMIPTTIPLIQNVCLSILRAKNKMKFRTIAIYGMLLFNLLFTVIGVKYIGAIAACIGTAIGLVGANIIAMNIYYKKVLKLNILRIFKGIFSKIWVCCAIGSCVLLFLNIILPAYSWWTWLLKAVVYIITYGVCLLMFGMQPREKEKILGFFKKRNKS